MRRYMRRRRRIWTSTGGFPPRQTPSHAKLALPPSPTPDTLECDSNLASYRLLLIAQLCSAAYRRDFTLVPKLYRCNRIFGSNCKIVVSIVALQDNGALQHSRSERAGYFAKRTLSKRGATVRAMFVLRCGSGVMPPFGRPVPLSRSGRRAERCALRLFSLPGEPKLSSGTWVPVLALA
jgi:hypothetical protein